MKLKELLQCIKDEYALKILERLNNYNNRLIYTDRLNDEEIFMKLENQLNHDTVDDHKLCDLKKKGD